MRDFDYRFIRHAANLSKVLPRFRRAILFGFDDTMLLRESERTLISGALWHGFTFK